MAADNQNAPTGKTIFGLPEFKPHAAEFHARLNRLIKHRRYADGTIYQDAGFKLAHKLYAQTMALFNILSRAVELDMALIPGMMQPWDLADKTPKAQRDAQALLYEWSAWDVGGDDWLEDGTETGEALLKIVPDPARRMVKMMRLKPEQGYLCKHARDGVVTDLLLVVDRSMRDEAGNLYEYAEAITPLEIRTYRNGDPHGYGDNPDRYDNPLGFVPVVAARNDSECRPTFGKVMAQLDRVNEMASYLGDMIGRHLEPIWAAAGVQKSEVEKGGNMLFMPADAKLEAVLAELDIAGTLAFVQEVKGETKAALPELAFDDLRAKDQIATETLEVQLIEPQAKIWRMRRRYDAALVDAHRMAALAALAYGIDGLAPLLAPHGFDYKRPVWPSSRLEQIRLEQAELALEQQRRMGSGEGMTNATTGGNVPGSEQDGSHLGAVDSDDDESEA